MFNPYIGILKFIMSLFVVAIHVRPFNGNLAFYYNDCITRIADPAFFTLSSYFLFDKLIKNNWDKNLFFKQITHLFKYYFIWLIVFSPVIISRTWNRTNNIFLCIGDILKQIFLSGTYGALWFLPALLLGLILTYIIGKKYSSRMCLFISFPFFLLTILETEYFIFIKDISWISTINQFFVFIFGWLGNGINFGFFFCSLGLFIATQKKDNRKLSFDLIKLSICIILLILECTIIRKYQLGISYGAMFFLIPVSYYLLHVILNMKPSKNTKFESISKHLQNMSLLIFPLHYGIMEAMQYFLQDQAWYTSSSSIQYLIVIMLTCTISALILRFAKTYKFFQYFYGK